MQTGSAIYKTLILGGQLSVSVLDTALLVREAAARHRLSPLCAQALGRVMTASAYLCSWLKERSGRLFVTVSGSGTGGKIRVTGDGAMRICGSMERTDVSLPPLSGGGADLCGCIGSTGYLSVARSEGGIPFTGVCALEKGDVVSDFERYFAESEQRETKIALFVCTEGSEVTAAGGIFLQPLPGAGGQALAYMKEKARSLEEIAKQIGRSCAEEILKREFGAEEVSIRSIEFACGCSRSAAAAALLSLGKEETEAVLSSEGKITVRCPDCGMEYVFGEEDVAEMFNHE